MKRGLVLAVLILSLFPGARLRAAAEFAPFDDEMTNRNLVLERIDPGAPEDESQDPYSEGLTPAPPPPPPPPPRPGAPAPLPLSELRKLSLFDTRRVFQCSRVKPGSSDKEFELFEAAYQDSLFDG